uniref:30S ribosomal protein S3 n=1 Tax=Nephromyces sp. ex Molgula occidentalis TaxID=2544991 RepID=A0A5C1H7P3_9APIC|nr:30S ribosomal protein S3 [Nephromyces sp. ex Molgula occidentalis]
MGKKIHPFLLRTRYYPNYKFLNKTPFNLSKNNFKIILDIYYILKFLEKKFIFINTKIIISNYKTIIIYLIIPDIKNIFINQNLIIKQKQEKDFLLKELNTLLDKLNYKYKQQNLFKVDIITSKKYFNYTNYLFYLIKDLIKKMFSLKNIFTKILEELNILKSNNFFILQGIKIKISGRINGAELAKIETYKKGIIPLHSIINNIQYNKYNIKTKFGLLGIKIWLFLS